MSWYFDRRFRTAVQSAALVICMPLPIHDNFPDDQLLFFAGASNTQEKA
jgi:hypothetical protein